MLIYLTFTLLFKRLHEYRVHARSSAWGSEDEPCHQKLSLDMWTFMKAEGSAKDADAQHVYVECLQQPEMGLVELITPKVYANVRTPGEFAFV